MKRDLLCEIKRWNSSGERRKPLVRMGTRQVGKTWLLNAFAEACYQDETVFVDLQDDEPPRSAIGEGATEALGILELISTVGEKKIVPGRTLDIPLYAIGNAIRKL